MPSPDHLDLRILRMIVHAAEDGGFARAAQRVGRSQSAVSLQLRRLEEQLGVRLFQKHGRALKPNAAGRTFLEHAKQLLELNDQALAEVQTAVASSEVRFGVSPYFAEFWLPRLLKTFKARHPEVHLEVTIDQNAVLLKQFRRGELDLALAFGDERGGGNGKVVAQIPMIWIGPPRYARTTPVQLALFSPPCPFRQAALRVLRQNRVKARLAFTSSHLQGLWAAVKSNLGITVHTHASIPRGLQALSAKNQLPALPTVNLYLHHQIDASPACAGLRALLLDLLREETKDLHRHEKKLHSIFSTRIQPIPKTAVRGSQENRRTG